jgi:hypothetical protein
MHVVDTATYLDMAMNCDGKMFIKLAFSGIGSLMWLTNTAILQT